MNAREKEQAVVSRCVRIAKGSLTPISDAAEANAAKLAAGVLRSNFPLESSRLRTASLKYFFRFPESELPPQEIIERGWIPSLPRFRDLLEAAICRG